LRILSREHIRRLERIVMDYPVCGEDLVALAEAAAVIAKAGISVVDVVEGLKACRGPSFDDVAENIRAQWDELVGPGADRVAENIRALAKEGR
jgi:hypothetical protein